jgi:hypothetical protein
MSYSSEKRRLERKHLAEQAASFASDLRERPQTSAKAWAWRLKRREESGENLPKHLKAAWRQALGET